MRNAFAETIYKLAKDDPKIVVIVADISPAGAMNKFREDFPERFINVGVSEQIMIGMAAGLAQQGFKVFCYTIATFALFRTYEFIRDDLAYQNLPVTIVGIGGGVSYSTLGATHHAMEDVSVCYSIPNMGIMAPCDPYETEMVTKYCAGRTEGGPIYVRLGKAGEPNLSIHEEGLGLGVRPLVVGNYSKCFIGYGPILKLAVKASQTCIAAARPSVFSIPTLSPLDESAIKGVLEHHSRVVVLEEMLSDWGLGTKIKQLVYDNLIHCRVSCVGLKREFKHVYGTHDDLLAAHGITTDRLLQELFS